MQDESLLKSIEDLAKKEKLEMYKISGVTGEGVNELIDHVSEVLKTLPGLYPPHRASSRHMRQQI